MFKKILKEGSRGLEVQDLQGLLVIAGYPLKIDSYFGSQTEKAIRTFQDDNLLDIDGVVGLRTEEALRVKAEEASKLFTNAKITDGTITDATPSKEFTVEMAADILGVEIEAIQAVAKVESTGSGFLESGKPKILFEGHVFWRQLKKRGISPYSHESLVKSDILYPSWTREHYKGGQGEYERLERARKIHEVAALESASWGAYQVMGYHWKALGYESVDSFVKAMYKNSGEHLRAFVRYIQVNDLARALRNKDWVSFARGYNGPGFAHNDYDGKMEREYNDYKNR